MNLQDFLSMSGYAAYVWPCYGLTAAVLIWMVWSARSQWRREIVRAQRRVLSQQQTGQQEVQS